MSKSKEGEIDGELNVVLDTVIVYHPSVWSEAIYDILTAGVVYES